MKSGAAAKRTLTILGIVGLIFLARCGGGASQLDNNPPPPPAPAITAISPTTAAAGSAAFTLTINGTNFSTSSTVSFGGSAPATTFVNSTQLTVAIPATNIASAGAVAVKVISPAGGGTSNAMNFIVTSGTNPVPAISNLYPTCAPAGEQFIDATDNLLTVVGNGFGADSVVQWNGSSRPTASNGSINGLVAQISASDIATAGTATVTVFNSGPGGGSSNPLTFTITPGGVDPQSAAIDPTGKFAYVLNAGCDGSGAYVSMYTINSATGALASMGPPVYTNGFGVYPGSIAVAPAGTFAYVTNEGDPWGYEVDANGSIAMFSIDATTGALTSKGTMNGNCPGLCDPSPMVVDPSGKFAYVVTGGAGIPFNVAMYSIDSTTGGLTSTGTIATGGVPVSIVVDPSGKFVYMAIPNDTVGSPGNVFAYSINATTGALTSVGTIAAGTNPASVVTDPASKFAYVANSGSNDVSMYSIDATTGALTSIGTMAAGNEPTSMVVDPTGKFAYVTDYGSNEISMYTINTTTGALTSIGTMAAESTPTSITIHPSGKFAYVTNSGSNDVSIYSIDATTGALTLVGTIGT
jgi:6-phosphogluconolactonase (cycloisomerase 2 family)